MTIAAIAKAKSCRHPVPMILLALALQAAHPLPDDQAFVAAHRAWAECTNRFVDAEAGSRRSPGQIAAAALAACASEEAATRRATIAFSGEARGTREMEVLRNASREGLSRRVLERRRRSQAYETAAIAWARCTRDRVDVPSAARNTEQEIIDAAFAACANEEAAVRAATVRMLGSEAAADRVIVEGRTIADNAMRNHLRRRRR